MASEQQTDLKALSNTLSTSYSTLLQYNSLTNEQIIEQLKQLSTYSNHLPLTWFTDVFLRVLLELEPGFAKENSLRGREYVFDLLSVWSRRISGASPSDVQVKQPLLTSVLKLFTQTLLTHPMDPSTVPLCKSAWLALVSFIGCAPDFFNEERLLATMTQIIQQFTQQPMKDTTMIESIEAGVAHALAQSSALNVFEMEQCQHLLETLVQLESQRHFEGIRSVITLMEHAVDIRSQLTPTTRAEADLDTLYTLAEVILEQQTSDTLIDYYTKLAIVSGIVRMLQFNRGEKTEKVQAISQKAQALFIKHFENVLQKTIDRQHASTFIANQDIIAYISSQCLPNIPTETLKPIDLKSLLQVLVSCFLTSENIWKKGEIVQHFDKEPVLIELQKNALYKEIGRISRSIGKVIQVLLEQNIEGAPQAIQIAVDRLEGLSYNVFIDWDRYIMQHDMTLPTKSATKTNTSLESNIWSIFKTMVFAYTAILKSVAVDVLDGQCLISVPLAAQGILSCYANLHFINEKLGSANGFQAYQETLTNCVAYLKHKDNICQLNKLMSLAFREYGNSNYTLDQTPSIDMLSPVQRTRLLFFVNLSEQVMDELEDQVLEQDVLPVIYPILKWKTIIDKELFESAHAVILSIFAAQKPASREVSGSYASILMNSFPKPLTHHQIRHAYVTMVQSLCEVDDALAWLTVQHVLERINQLQDEKDAVLRSEYLVILIDLLKPLSLCPFFSKALNLVEKLIKRLESKGMQQSAMKMLYETVSGSGVSDMRKVEAVGWYLELKRQLGL